MTMNFDTLAQNVRHAGRRFLREPLASATIVVTVGLGLGLVAAVYAILNSMVFNVDDVYNPDELFGVERQQSAIAQPETYTRARFETLLRETDVFSGAFATTSDIDAWIEGVEREGRLVTGNFFQVLGVNAFLGRVFAPAHDEAGSPPVIVLSHRAWVQQYRSDPGVLDRTYRVNGRAVQIIGVMPEGFRGLEVLAAPDFWAPLAHIDLFRGQGSANDSATDTSLNVVGRLRPGLSREAAVARLNAWDLQRAAPESSSERPARLVLEPRLGTAPWGGEIIVLFMPLFFAFGLILLIGCANVGNLVLARLIERQREIGIRLAIGASRGRVLLQLLTENLVLALIASALGFAISRLVLKGVVYWVTTSFPPEIGSLRIVAPGADWRVMIFLVAGAVVSTVLFALFPALRATSVDPTRAIFGRAFGEGRPGPARNALVSLQVTGSALLLICAAIFLRSAWSSAAIDPGLRVTDVVSIEVMNESRREAILNSVRTDASVGEIAAAWPGVIGGSPAYAEGASGRSVVSYQLVSPEYFRVLEVDLLRGRGFTDSERNTNEPVAVVSESVGRQLWPGADPLGQVLRLEPDPAIGRPETGATAEAGDSDNPLLAARTAVVVGVARDVPGFLAGSFRIGGAGIYLPVSAEVAGTSLITRVRGDVELGRLALIDRLTAFDRSIADVSTLQRLSRINTYIFGMSFRLTLALGLLALLLTMSGLFGVLSYLVEQRAKEIGVRMALGASNGSIGRLVLSQLARPIGIGLLFGVALTAGLGTALLATPAADQIAAIVRLFDPFAYAAGLLCIVAACAGAALIPARRAGRVNPLVALRQD